MSFFEAHTFLNGTKDEDQAKTSLFTDTFPPKCKSISGIFEAVLRERDT